MKDYFFSFRLSEKESDKGSYDERYEAMYEALKGISNGYWLRPTSFGIFGCDLSAEDILKVVAEAIDESIDLFVLGLIEYKGIYVIGNYSSHDAEVLASLVADLHLQ